MPWTAVIKTLVRGCLYFTMLLHLLGAMNLDKNGQVSSDLCGFNEVEVKRSFKKCIGFL